MAYRGEAGALNAHMLALDEWRRRLVLEQRVAHRSVAPRLHDARELERVLRPRAHDIAVLIQELVLRRRRAKLAAQRAVVDGVLD